MTEVEVVAIMAAIIFAGDEVTDEGEKITFANAVMKAQLILKEAATAVLADQKNTPRRW